MPLRKSRRPLRSSALWLWSRCSHQWLHDELGDDDRDDVVVVQRVELVDEPQERLVELAVRVVDGLERDVDAVLLPLLPGSLVLFFVGDDGHRDQVAAG